MAKKLANDFEKIINDGRERRKNQALAQSIFSQTRRRSGPSVLEPGAGPSLARRVGVKKSQSSTSIGSKPTPRAPAAFGNRNDSRTEGLRRSANGSPIPGTLASRVAAPGAKSTKRATQIANAIERSEQPFASTTATQSGPGLTIRGLAGPISVIAENFAPGTSAADIESAMTPVGGEMLQCDIIETMPLMVAEMMFVSREGGERVIQTFHSKTADGRVLKVYEKPGGRGTFNSSKPPTGPRADRQEHRSAPAQVIDGSRGFSDGETTNARLVTGTGSRPLYSDDLVGATRRGRGFRGNWTNQ